MYGSRCNLHVWQPLQPPLGLRSCDGRGSDAGEGDVVHVSILLQHQNLSIATCCHGRRVLKRDMDLIREVLLKLEEQNLDGDEYQLDVADLGITNHSVEEVAYHVASLSVATCSTRTLPNLKECSRRGLLPPEVATFSIAFATQKFGV